MNTKRGENLVLSLYPTSRGFAFVLLEGPESPVDWGVKDVKGRKKNSDTLDTIQKLFEQYEPEVVVIENTNEKGSRRSARIRRLYRSIEHLATSRSAEVYRYSRRDTRATFALVGAVTKYEIAKAIAQQIPAFAHRLPRLRKLWMSEDPRQSLFDAIALAQTHHASPLRNQCGPQPYSALDGHPRPSGGECRGLEKVRLRHR
jgi:Holliday junction resolvasome RuvABC endonuclease subunit